MISTRRRPSTMCFRRFDNLHRKLTISICRSCPKSIIKAEHSELLSKGNVFRPPSIAYDLSYLLSILGPKSRMLSAERRGPATDSIIPKRAHPYENHSFRIFANPQKTKIKPFANISTLRAGALSSNAERKPMSMLDERHQQLTNPLW